MKKSSKKSVEVDQNKELSPEAKVIAASFGLKVVAERFLAKLETIEKDPGFKNVFLMAFHRGMEYHGPDWSKEKAELERALRRYERACKRCL